MKFLHLLLPFLLLGISLNAAAEPVAVPLDASQQVFFSRFRTAVQGEDIKQIIRLTHPLAVQCTSEEDRTYQYGKLLEDLAAILGRRQLVQEVGVAPVDEEIFESYSTMITKHDMGWPLLPEKQIVVKYTTSGLAHVATIYIARHQDQWKWVHICTE